MEVNKKLIVKETTEGNIKEYIIKKYRDGSTESVKLSEVFTNKLPSGLVYKEETGMGATTLELTTPRNSIIVEPIKITASSKASKHKALYVGSPTKYHRNKVQFKEIKAYIENDSISPKKIVVVADSLFKVIDAIGKAAYKDYFLLIDEIDSFQMDSSFRRSMEGCMDIYKRFPIANRAMVSSTPLSFSDPVLAKEPVTVIKYDEPTYRIINLFYSENLKGGAVDKIKELLTSYPNDKIMVAYNSVAGCYELAEFLVKDGCIKKEEVRILCSLNSKKKVANYFAELESDILPVRLNFVTSAYFTGFDLIEDFHLVSISGNANRIHSLSDKRLKQIAGRCRTKLKSETILYDLVPFYVTLDESTVEDCINAANAEIQALGCIKLNFLSNDILQQSYDKIRELIIANAQSHGNQFVRTKGDNAVISYLNIDSYIESNRIGRELYFKTKILENVLKEAGHDVKESSIITDTEVESKSLAKGDREEQILSVIEMLRSIDNGKEPKDLLREVGITKLQEEIIMQYHYLFKSLDNEQLLTLMEQEAKKRDSRSFNSLMLAAFFVTLHPEEQYKRIVNFHIPLKKVFTNEELLKKWNDIFIEMNMQRKLKTEIQAIKLTGLHFHTIKRKDNKTKKPIGHYIKSENPLKLIRTSYKPIVNHQTEGYYIFQRLF